MSGGGSVSKPSVKMFAFGNKHKFDMKDVTRFKDEKLDDLNKIEIRYNVRKNYPGYPAMKSLYRWRSVFGYHLGGLLRQAVVKLADIKRPFINTVNLARAVKSGDIRNYTRLYSSRDVMKAMMIDQPNSPKAKMMKYLSFDTIPERMHKETASNDYSVRHQIMKKFMQNAQNKSIEGQYKDDNKTIAEYNKESKLPGDNTGIVDVKDKMKEIDGRKKAFRRENWENEKERIAFKVNCQKERLGRFFKDWARDGIKVAYKELSDRARDDEEHYQRRFYAGIDDGPLRYKRGDQNEMVRERPRKTEDDVKNNTINDAETI